jgi:hypothetical protein
MHGPTLLIIGTTLGIAAAAGALAAFGPAVVRVGIFAVCVLLLVDVSFHLPAALDVLRPETRTRMTRDEQRVADLHRIKAALDRYATEVGPLPTPVEYGQGTGPSNWWKDMWDFSSDGGFLNFLVDDGLMTAVPTDPVNEAPPDGDPRGGKQYVYFVVPDGYEYAGGTCDPRPNRWHYMVAVTDLEEETARPPWKFKGSGCQCLWRDQPDFFEDHFDYILCGSFEATPASLASAAQSRAKRKAAKEAAEARALAQKQAVEGRKYIARDQRRVADLQEIDKALRRYVREIGPLPRPPEYGQGRGPWNWWKDMWDYSSDGGFLDFLVADGILTSVPTDPVNEAPKHDDPRGGKQYVYFVIPAGYEYLGGVRDPAPNRWHYMLAITDLESEFVRPPQNISGSGCSSLWRDEVDFFQQHFDYVLCGSFDSTPESRARAAQIRAKRAAAKDAAAAAALVKKQEAAGRPYIARDQRRVADLREIDQALRRYVKEIGPLPRPSEYGQGSGPQNWWREWWDVSSDGGFLDFLVDAGVMPVVPKDPVDQAPTDQDPRGGKQYVYFVVPPDYDYLGGVRSPAPNRWHYMLAITDLEAGSGCPALWRDEKNFFQQHFDYVMCGSFDATPESRARAAQARANAKAARVRKQASRAGGP